MKYYYSIKEKIYAEIMKCIIFSNQTFIIYVENKQDIKYVMVEIKRMLSELYPWEVVTSRKNNSFTLINNSQIKIEKSNPLNRGRWYSLSWLDENL